MAIAGLRHTENFGTNVRPENWREGILLQYPNGDFPLLALTSQMKTEKTDDPAYHWFEKDLDARRIKLSADLSAAATSLTVASGAKTVVKNTLLKNLSNGEIMKVTADPASDTAITVERGFASTTATAITVASQDPFLLVIGVAFEEGSAAPTGQGYDPYERSNYTQIFRRTLEITRTAAATRLRTGDQVKEAKRECLEYISIDLERAFWFGEKSLTYVNNKPCRTMSGIYQQIKDNAPLNIYDASTETDGVTYEWLENVMKNLFKHGQKEKMGFCGDTFLLTIQRILRNVKNTIWNIDAGAKEYGMDVTKLRTPFGTLVLKTCPLFNNIGTEVIGNNTIYGLDSYCFVLDMSKVSYVVFDKDDLHYQAKLNEEGLDGDKSGYLAEVSIKLAQAANHGIIKNLTVAKEVVDTVIIKEAATETPGAGEETGS